MALTGNPRDGVRLLMLFGTAWPEPTPPSLAFLPLL
jgi:hypothetical protein